MENDIIIPDEEHVHASAIKAFGTSCMYCGEPAEMVCDECEAQNQAAEAQRVAEQEAAHKAERRAAFREKVGDYADTELARLPEGAAREIATTYPLGSLAGLTLSGTGGKGKTRAAVFVAQKELEQSGAWVEFRQCGALRQEMAAFARNGEWARGIKPLMKCDILILDDLGNHDITRNLEEMLLAVLEERTSRRKRTFVTTQYTTDELRGTDGKAGVFSTMQMADAILRRIGRQFATIVNTTANTITPWK